MRACQAMYQLRQELAVRRYLERSPQLRLTLRQIDPLIRQLTVYRDLIDNRSQENQQ
jgi:hypothetical protein